MVKKQSLDMLLLSSTSVPPAYEGDFCAEVTGNELLLHPDTLSILNKAGIGTPDVVHFLSYVRNFPTAVASALGWNVANVDKAYEKLKKQLDKYLPDEILNPKPIKRGYGALTPKPDE